jgi:D-sorbitol dehydrogenase (acceptor)
MRLHGKTALITGGARGIGAAIAEAYLREGARVVLSDRDGEAVARAAARLGEGARPMTLDVTDLDAIERAVAEVEAEDGGLDILVNNAALFDMAPITHITPEGFETLMAVNVRGPLFLMKAAANAMIARGRGGRIINMASQAGRRGEALVVLYCLTKAAIVSATQSAALDLARHGITVNTIAPGVVDAEHWEGVDAHFAKWEGLAPGEKRRAVGAAVPIGRMARPDEIAPMAVFLAADEAAYVLAQTYGVDGGNWMA